MSMRLLGAALLMLVTTSCATQTGARAVITGTTPGSPVSGLARLTETPQGLRVAVRVAHVPPGRHGFHIHEVGLCGDEGKAAGGHYNPAGVPHGFLPTMGVHAAHAGDFGNIAVGRSGRGRLTLTLPGLTLTDGEFPVVGRAVILHAQPDDLTTQPTGNAGARIGCGVIEAAPAAAR